MPRHKWKFGCLITALLALCAMGYVGHQLRQQVEAKTSAAHSTQFIAWREIREVAPEAQMEDQTCGLHTLRMIYQSYGLDPDEKNLRFRLGLDVPANPWDDSSTGTLPFDMVRVLVQDGFAYQMLSVEGEHAEMDLLDHLEAGQTAAVLVRRPSTGGLHWITAVRGETPLIKLLDSLEPDPVLMVAKEFLAHHVISCILVSPADPTVELHVRDSERDGAREMIKSVQRIARLKKLQQELQHSSTLTKCHSRLD